MMRGGEETPRLPDRKQFGSTPGCVPMLGMRDGEESNGAWGESCPDADRAGEGELSAAGWRRTVA